MPLLITRFSRTTCHFLDNELNIPPAPCYDPIFPQHPVMSQYSPSTLLWPSIPPPSCYVPIFPQQPVMSQYSPSNLLCPNISPSTLLCPNIPPAPCYVPIIPSFPHTQQFSIYVRLPTTVNKKVLIRSANNSLQWKFVSGSC